MQKLQKTIHRKSVDELHFRSIVLVGQNGKKVLDVTVARRLVVGKHRLIVGVLDVIGRPPRRVESAEVLEREVDDVARLLHQVMDGEVEQDLLELSRNLILLRLLRRHSRARTLTRSFWSSSTGSGSSSGEGYSRLESRWRLRRHSDLFILATQNKWKIVALMYETSTAGRAVSRTCGGDFATDLVSRKRR